MDRNDKKITNKEGIVLYVRIQYRRNTSWQGSVQWLDGKESCTFRSVLELGNLFKDAKRSASGDSEGSQKSNRWEDKEDVS